MFMIAEEVLNVDPIAVEGSELDELVNMPEATIGAGARLISSS